MNEKLKIAREITRNFNLSIDPEWLKDCMDYLQIMNFKTEFTRQLLYSDLNEIIVESPGGGAVDNTIDAHNVDNKMMQIMEIKEIGISSYELLKQLNDSKQLSRKMLKLSLSDGLKQVFSITNT